MSRLRDKHGWVYRGALIFVLMLAVLVNAGWLTSPFWKTHYYHPGFELEVGDGRANIAFIHLDDPHKRMDGLWITRLSRSDKRVEEIFGLPRIVDIGGAYVYVIPLWLPMLLLYAWPLVVLFRWRPGMHPAGCCSACGYDLRGSKGSAACPECGEKV